jgi:16S rRNA (cytosine1402-N4)-methyltransferase
MTNTTGPLIHLPVLLEESMQALALSAGGLYVDATFGRGGHARAMLQRLDAAARVIGCDRDPDAVAAGRALAEADSRFSIHQTAFSQLPELLKALEIAGRVRGLLVDLGVSSPQLDTPHRGFGFSADGPLDMRMDPSLGTSAADWLETASEGEISRCLFELGEERYARRISRSIVRARNEAPIVTTSQLAELVAGAVPTREPGKHPATRTFQALRIQVNDELGELRALLAEVCDLLVTGGRLAVISFHSLEDRIVKRFIRSESQGAQPPRSVPVRAQDLTRRLRPVAGPIKPSAAEIEANPRSRSAVLRVAERLA